MSTKKSWTKNLKQPARVRNSRLNHLRSSAIVKRALSPPLVSRVLDNVHNVHFFNDSRLNDSAIRFLWKMYLNRSIGLQNSKLRLAGFNSLFNAFRTPTCFGFQRFFAFNVFCISIVHIRFSQAVSLFSMTFTFERSASERFCYSISFGNVSSSYHPSLKIPN